MKPVFRLAAFVFLFFLCCLTAQATTITVASTTLQQTWSNPDTAPRLRIYVNKPAVTSTSGVLQSGSPSSGVFYKSVTCSVAGGILTIPLFTIDSLTDALVGSDAKYSAWFYSSAGAQIVVYRGFEGFSIPPSPTSTTHAAILQFNLTTVPFVDNLTYSRRQIDTKIAALSTPLWGSLGGSIGNQTDLSNALALKAPLASPTFTGSVTVPTPGSATDATTKSYVDTQVATKENPLTFNAPLARSTNAISMPAATSGQNGYLSSTDWSIFNNKQAAISVQPRLTFSSNVLDLATSGVSAGSCTACNLTIDQYGRVTVQANGAGGGGDASTNTGSSVDSEVALFSGTGGKTLKRATGSGVAHLASGVLSAGNVNLASEVTGQLPIANGGTGSATQNFIDLTNAQTAAGVKTFSSLFKMQQATVNDGGWAGTGAAADATHILLVSNGTSTGKVFLSAITSGSTYPGIWFGNITPSLSNYSFLFDPDLGNTILNGTNAIDLRVSNAGAWYIDSNKNFFLQTTNAFDLGDASHKVRTGFFATSVESAVFKTTTALITATGGSTPAFGTNFVGGTGGPATAAQNGWLKMQDSSGATVFVPVWK